MDNQIEAYKKIYSSELLAMKIIWGVLSFALLVYCAYLINRASKNKEKIPKINSEQSQDQGVNVELIQKDTPLDMMNDNTVEGLIN
jgi:hypothetical protein